MISTHVSASIGLIVRLYYLLMLSPEIKITIRVYLCSRCGHLWERRVKGAKGLPTTCPSCNSPYWNTKAKDEKKLLPLMFHGEEVLVANFDEIYGREKESRKK